MERVQIITEFYTAFHEARAEDMVAHYHNEATFSDPAFVDLKGEEVKNMWRMLIDRGKGQLTIEFSNVREEGSKVYAHWEAQYLFSQTGRQVHNKIDAEFEFEGDKIIKHIDRFDFWKWSSMALGAPGTLLGWTPFLKNKVRKQCRYLLANYKPKTSKD